MLNAKRAAGLLRDGGKIFHSLALSKDRAHFWKQLAAIGVAWAMHEPSEKALKWLLKDEDMWTVMDIAGRYPLR